MLPYLAARLLCQRAKYAFRMCETTRREVHDTAEAWKSPPARSARGTYLNRDAPRRR